VLEFGQRVESAIVAVQAQVLRRVLRVFVRHSLIEKCNAEEMAGISVTLY
jgi:hypothetical protein